MSEFPDRNLDALHKAAKGEAIHAPDGKSLEEHIAMAVAALKDYPNGSLSMVWDVEQQEWYVHLYSADGSHKVSSDDPQDDIDATLDGHATEGTLDMALYNALGDAGLIS